MIAETGLFLLVLAFFAAAIGAVLAAVGAKHEDAAWTRAARRAAGLTAALTACSFAALIALFASSDFSVANVAANSTSDTAPFYKIAAAWSSHEGSMLLWTALLALFGAVLGCGGRERPRMRALAVQLAMTAVFLLYLLTASNPFARLDPAPPQGDGLNPLLADPALALHPPLLYLGYVGFSAVFALAIAALMEKRLDADTTRTMRRWTLFSWSMLTLGIGLGAWWSYYTLGWGGWWAWDPVENAALMPWLIGTALLHTLPAMQKRGTLAGWTLFLAVAAFSLSLLGAFVVRSGLIASVHAFASDPTRGIFILAIFVLFAAGALALFAARAPKLPRAPLFTPLSREGGIVAADLLLTFATAAVLAGTLFPLMTNGAAVDRSYFDRLTLWLAVPLTLLAAAGPFLSWRRSEPAALRRPAYAAAAGLLAGLAAFSFVGIAAAGIGLAAFLAACLILLRKNAATMLAHFGLAVLIAGIAVSTPMRQEKTVLFHPGETTAFAGYDVGLKRLYEVAGANDTVLRAELTLTRNGKPAGSLTPAIRAFADPPLARAEAAIRTDLLRDLYVMPGAADGKGGFSMHLFYNPLQPWIFIGMALMAAGGWLAFLRRPKAEVPATVPPRKRRHRFVFVLPLGAVLAVAALLAIRLPPPGESPPDAGVGQAAPAFDLPSLTGGSDLALAELKGKPAIVNFFASWCAPCQAEAPALRLLKTRGAPLYGIAYKDGKAAARKFLAATGNPYVAAAIDAEGKTAAAFGATGVPETFVLDKRGIVRFHHAGPIDEKAVETDILPLLRRLE